MNADLFENFKWDYQSELRMEGEKLIMSATPHSNYFVDPAYGNKDLSGPYYHIETHKDFMLKAKVSHAFKNVYDACALMVMSDDTCWGKLCFEFTDIGTHSVVSVVTNGVSDDANGVDIHGNSVYLQMAKKGNLFGMHYSLDGHHFNMVRYFSLPVKEIFKLGFVAQSPRGDGGDFMFDDIQFDFSSLKDLRKGI